MGEVEIASWLDQRQIHARRVGIGNDSLDLGGARTEWNRVQGTLHLAAGAVLVHWRIVRREEEVGLFHVQESERETPPDVLSVPLSWIAHARVTGGWFAPTLELRAQWTDAFARVPGSGLGVLAMRVAEGLAGGILQPIPAIIISAIGPANASALPLESSISPKIAPMAMTSRRGKPKRMPRTNNASSIAPSPMTRMSLLIIEAS